MRGRKHLDYLSWDEYVLGLNERLGQEYDDPMDEMKNLRLDRSVNEYHGAFGRVRQVISLPLMQLVVSSWSETRLILSHSIIILSHLQFDEYIGLCTPRKMSSFLIFIQSLYGNISILTFTFL